MGNRAGAPPESRMSMEYHPWDDAGTRYRDWVIRRCHLDGLHEVMCMERKVILLEAERTKWERRCDLAHAIAHIDLGHGSFDDKSEAAAIRHAAKRLLRYGVVADALVQTHGEVTPETAEILGVDPETLHARLSHLHPAERAFIRRRLSGLIEARVA